MLLGGDLGLLYSSVVAAVVVLVVGRVKWRRMVARQEEIKRRMAFAWEEAARAELEAAVEYSTGSGYDSPSIAVAVAVEAVEELGSSPGRQIHYQCEVCFSPTTTRCKRCKSVRYCSGKCQIIHWRQGHKDECRSFSSQQDMDERGIHSSLKEFEQYEIRSTSSVIGHGIKNNTNPVESSSGEWMFTKPTLHVASGVNETKVETSNGGSGIDRSVKTVVGSLPTERFSSTILNDMPATSDSNLDDTNRQRIATNTKSLLLKQPILPKPDINSSASSASNQLKSGCVDIDEQSESSTSSSYGATCSEEHSLSEPSTPSSGFWEGTVESIRTKIDTLDELSDTNMSNHRSSCFSTLGRKDYHTEVLGTDMNKFKEDAPCPTASFPKKLTHEAALSKVSEGSLKSTKPSFLNREMSVNSSVTDTSVGCTSMMVSSSSSVHHKLNINGGHVFSKEVEVCSSNSLAQKQLDNEIDGINVILDNVKRLENDSPASRASEAHLSSGACTRKQAILNEQSVENECPLRVPATSVENSAGLRNSGGGAKPSVRKVLDQHRAPRIIRHGSVGTGSGTIAKYEVSFPYELFVKLYNWNMVELRPSGLVNCGNSCYANAVLQCLAFTPPLTAYFLQGLHSKACDKKEWCITCEFEALVKRAKEGFSPLSPARIISQMQRIGSHLGDGREEDAHEFLRYAIDAMQIVCLKEVAVNVPSSFVEETTLIGLTFGGYLRSKIQCMRCRGKSEQHERIMDLTVEIGGDIGTLEEALRQFTRSEILDGENKYHCGRCKSYEKAKKKLRVSEAPNILTIALKRFQSGKFGKLNKAVKFPKILNLAPYMCGTSDKSPIYALYGVVVHLDVMNAAFSGHYVCYVKNNQGRWFQADDSTVQVVELEKVLSRGAYMLLYARCSPRAPRRIRSLMVPPKTHGSKPLDISVGDLNGQTCNDCFNLHSTSYRSSRDIEDESLSEKSSFFSESGSYSTESSNRDSTSIDDNFDQVLHDMRNCWSRQWRNSSDSDTSSPSSSPSTLHARHSPLADLGRYSAEPETSGSCSINVSSNGDGDCFWERTHKKVEVSRGKERDSLSCPDSHFECRKLGNSSSCRENDSNRLGGNDSRDNAKGVYLRTMTGRAV